MGFTNIYSLLGHRLGDVLTHLLLEVVSIRPFTRSFSDFDLIWCVGRLRPHMCKSMTYTQYKVKVKDTQFVKFGKSHFSRSISFSIFAWSSKVTDGSDSYSIGPGLQFVRAQFRNFIQGQLSREFKLRRMPIFYDIQMTIFRQCVRLQSDG